MKLYLVQHGLSVDESEDSLRPLSSQGREDIVRTGGFLSLFERPQPVRIVHSNKLRSQQTAQMFSEAWGCKVVEQSMDLSPNSEAHVWASRMVETHADMMLVGHLPHLSRLAGLLITGHSDSEVVRFRNGGVLCLERVENDWRVCWHINPTLFYPED
ncbi:MAG: phosphohistidine phosphatase SixA [Mariprofundaceae bacterium]